MDVRECGKEQYEGKCIRGEEAEGRCRDDLGPTVLLAVMSPPGGAAYTKYTHDRGHSGLQTCGTCLYGRVRDAVLEQVLPRDLGTVVISEV
jgi:hypothetical protein